MHLYYRIGITPEFTTQTSITYDNKFESIGITGETREHMPTISVLGGLDFIQLDELNRHRIHQGERATCYTVVAV